MKGLIFTIALLALASYTYAQVNNSKIFNLQGKVDGQDTGYIHIGYVNSLNKYVNDSCYLKNGEFEFSGFINEPTIMSLYGNRKSRSVDDPNWTEFFIEPVQMKAVLKINEFKKARITGSATQDVYNVYNKQIDNLNKKWQPVFNKLNSSKTNNDSATVQAIYDEQLPQYRNESEAITISFIKEHPASNASAYLLQYESQRLELDSFKHLYALLPPAIQQSLYGKRIYNFIAKALKIEIGMPAPDFHQTDVNGKEVTLSGLKGNYVLLDFWASWCVPCREENPYLKQAYNKYHDKGFTIVSFSLDKLEDKKDWIHAIQQDSLPWIQLCDFKGWTGEVVNEYNLHGKGIPANFLLDAAGKIIAKDLRGNEVAQTLATLIK